MKRVDRSVVFLTLSALDTLATAIGVFVLLVALLMPYYQNSFDLEETVTQLRVAHEQNTAQLEHIKDRIAEESAKAAAALTESQQVSAKAAALEASIQPQDVAPEERGGDIETPIVKELDLVFVVDATASMRPVIHEIALTLRSIVRILESLVPSVRVGYVAYRDRDTGVAPVTTMSLTPTATDLDRAVAFAEELVHLTARSLTIDEDVHLGLAAAVAMPFRPSAKQVIVVIGDASAHPYAVAETLARAQAFAQASERRTVSTLFVTTPSSLSEGNRARPFFGRLAEAGGGAFNEHVGSMVESVLLSVLDE